MRSVTVIFSGRRDLSTSGATNMVKALTILENLPHLEKMMVKQCNGSPAKQ